MGVETSGELAFKNFCEAHRIPCKKIKEGSDSTPDYEVSLNGATVYVEVKDIEEDENFHSTSAS